MMMALSHYPLLSSVYKLAGESQHILDTFSRST
jgi:hypothetical protein